MYFFVFCLLQKLCLPQLLGNSIIYSLVNKDYDHLHFIYLDFISILILLSNDIHLNPGPPSAIHRDITICHINSQSLLNKGDLTAVELGKFNYCKWNLAWSDNWQLGNSHSKLPGTFSSWPWPAWGGVAVYFHKTFPFLERKELHIPNLEILWAEIILNNKKVLLGTCYLHSRFNDWDAVRLAIDQAMQSCPNIILIGDFNQNMLEESKSKHIREILNILNFNQIIDSPTRITQTSSTLIDLALTSASLTCTEKGVLDPFCSDHWPIFLSTSFVQVQKPCYSRKIWTYNRGDYNLFRDTLRERNWNIDNRSIDESVTLYTNNILQSAERAIPK